MSSATMPVLHGSLRSIAQQLTQLSSGSTPDYKDDKTWTNMDQNTMAHSTEHFLVSCGTVTLRPGFRHRQGGAEVLVTRRSHLNNAYMLPKGRKNLDDDSLWATADRETREETGVEVRPLYLKARTRFTIPDDMDVDTHKVVVPRGQGTGSKHKDINEVIAKDVIFSYAEIEPKYRAIRYVFLYPAQAVGDGAIDTRNLAEEDKGNSVEWLPIDKAIANLRMLVERETVMRMKTLLEGMTDEDWKVSEELSSKEA